MAIIQECLGIWLFIELGRDIMPINIFTKFIKTGLKPFDLESGNSTFGQFKGHNSGVPGDLAGYITWSRYYAYQHLH